MGLPIPNSLIEKLGMELIHQIDVNELLDLLSKAVDAKLALIEHDPAKRAAIEASLKAIEEEVVKIVEVLK